MWPDPSVPPLNGWQNVLHLWVAFLGSFPSIGGRATLSLWNKSNLSIRLYGPSREQLGNSHFQNLCTYLRWKRHSTVVFNYFQRFAIHLYFSFWNVSPACTFRPSLYWALSFFLTELYELSVSTSNSLSLYLRPPIVLPFPHLSSYNFPFFFFFLNIK